MVVLLHFIVVNNIYICIVLRINKSFVSLYSSIWYLNQSIIQIISYHIVRKEQIFTMCLSCFIRVLVYRLQFFNYKNYTQFNRKTCIYSKLIINGCISALYLFICSFFFCVAEEMKSEILIFDRVKEVLNIVELGQVYSLFSSINQISCFTCER